MFKKIKGYYEKRKQKREDRQAMLLSRCACQDCSFLETCLKGEKTRCFNEKVVNLLITYAVVFVFFFLFMSGLYSSVVDLFVEKGFTPEQVFDMLVR